ncbi:MAG TPA: DNA alkylation repair protein [Candidatus Dormibacteraeota bacterium]|nr:DNA alkylation repair protein [Candidatus Dormibacteraeota bacterium]
MRSRLLPRLRAELVARADPNRRAAMQAYMKSAMPFHGAKSAQVREAVAAAFAKARFASCDEWRAEVLAIWRDAKFREERYAALELAADRRHRDCRNPDSLPMVEEMIVTGAWWDYVDEVAHLIGDMLRAHPRELRPVMRRWSVDANMWKRRVSIICQISFKERTDLRLLYSNIRPNLADREFFIRKAIGWALRAYAWTDPVEVARYVRENESRLSGLSRREALKNVPERLR